MAGAGGAHAPAAAAAAAAATAVTAAAVAYAAYAYAYSGGGGRGDGERGGATRGAGKSNAEARAATKAVVAAAETEKGGGEAHGASPASGGAPSAFHTPAGVSAPSSAFGSPILSPEPTNGPPAAHACADEPSTPNAGASNFGNGDAPDADHGEEVKERIVEAVETLLTYKQDDGSSQECTDIFSNWMLHKLLKAWIPGKRHTVPCQGYLRKKAVRQIAAAVADSILSGSFPAGTTPSSKPAKEATVTPEGYAAVRADERKIAACAAIAAEFKAKGEDFEVKSGHPMLPVPIVEGAPVLLGGVKEAADVDKLKRLGVGYVLNCAQEEKTAPLGVDASTYEGTGIEYCNLGAVDMTTRNEWSPLMVEEQFVSEGKVGVRPEFELSDMAKKAMGFIARCERENQNSAVQKKVLIHCVEGLKRSGFVCAAYLVLREHYFMMDAVETVYRARRHSNCLGNHHFHTQLMVMCHHVGLLYEPGRVPEGLPPQATTPEEAFDGFASLSPARGPPSAGQAQTRALEADFETATS